MVHYHVNAIASGISSQGPYEEGNDIPNPPVLEPAKLMLVVPLPCVAAYVST